MLYYYALLADQWQKTEGGNFPVNFWKFENTNLQKLTGQNEDEEGENSGCGGRKLPQPQRLEQSINSDLNGTWP